MTSLGEIDKMAKKITPETKELRAFATALVDGMKEISKAVDWSHRQNSAAIEKLEKSVEKLTTAMKRLTDAKK